MLTRIHAVLIPRTTVALLGSYIVDHHHHHHHHSVFPLGRLKAIRQFQQQRWEIFG